MPRGTDQSTVDLTDIDMWARAVPYAEFGRLRREAPVAWSADEGPGFSSVSRYADIVAASRDVATFSSRGVSFPRGGPHLCLDVHLARLEVKVVLAALARRVSRFELAGEPRRIRSNFTNGLKALPVRISA